MKGPDLYPIYTLNSCFSYMLIKSRYILILFFLFFFLLLNFVIKVSYILFVDKETFS